MSKHDTFVKEIKEELKLDARLVDRVCRSVLTFTANVMRDPQDYRPIRWRYMGVFTLLKNKIKR